MKPDKGNNNGNNNKRNIMGLVSIIFWALLFTMMIKSCTSSYANMGTVEVPYTTFKEWLAEDKIDTVNVENGKYTFTLRDGVEVELPREETSGGSGSLMNSLIPVPAQTEEEKQYITVPLAGVDDPELLAMLEEHADHAYTEPVDESAYFLSLILSYVLPLLLMVGLMMFLFRGIGGKGGMGGLGGVGKANAKVYVEKKTGVTFRDVAGQDEAKESLQEIIDILHNPQKYTALLVGPPGTGKTLLAKAVAGEAGVPFFSISGSDFVEMFVGVGASRVRDLFKEASKMAPCIIFIDEIDTIGKSRDNRMGGNDEREQTLNQLLAELDGFDPGKGVIVLGATNRPEVLDKALLRPGRFDRRITIDRPNLAGRLATLQVHTRKIKLGEDVDLKKIALATAGKPAAGRAGRLRPGQGRHRAGGHQPARGAGQGPAAARPVRPPHYHRPAQPGWPSGHPPGPHPEDQAGRGRGPQEDRSGHRGDRGRRLGQPGERGRPAGSPARPKSGHPGGSAGLLRIRYRWKREEEPGGSAGLLRIRYRWKREEEQRPYRV